MVKKAVESDSRFEVSTVELDRPGVSYTVDTVRAVRAEHPDAELFLILGVDQFRELSTWHQPEELVRMIRLAVMDRGGESAAAVASDVPGGAQAIFVPVRRVDVSSTAIRSAVREGRDVAAWLVPPVAEIVEREGLYSGG